MRDDINQANIGQAPKDYDNQFFWRSYRDLELFFTKLLGKGPITVSTLTADDIVVDNMTVTNDLTVTDDVSIGGDLAVTGPISTPTLNAGDVNVSDDLVVTDDATIGGDLAVTGTVTAATVNAADVNVSDDLVVTDDASVGGDLTVTGTSGFTGLLSAVAATLSGALNGTTATFSGLLSGAAATFTGLLTTNGQVAFPATQNPSADPNTLDDYEEGSFTPGIEFGGSASGVTFNSRAGRYTKIGDTVFFRIAIDINNNGSGTGTCTITGLPFTVGVGGGAFFMTGSGFSGLSSPPVGFVSGTSITPRHWGATGIANLTDTNVPNSCAFSCEGFYFV